MVVPLIVLIGIVVSPALQRGAASGKKPENPKRFQFGGKARARR